MARAFVVVMDSVGCGGAPDAADFGDAGSNTLGHIAMACAAGLADKGRKGPLKMPHLDALGLGAALTLASGLVPPGLGAAPFSNPWADYARDAWQRSLLFLDTLRQRGNAFLAENNA